MMFESFNFNLKEKKPEQEMIIAENMEQKSNPKIIHKIFEIGASDGRFHKLLRVLTLSLALSGVVGKEVQAFSAQGVESAQEMLENEKIKDVAEKTGNIMESVKKEKISKEKAILNIIESARMEELREKILDLKSEIENKLLKADERSQEKLNGFLQSLDKISVYVDRLESNFDDRTYKYLDDRVGQILEKFIDFENSTGGGILGAISRNIHVNHSHGMHHASYPTTHGYAHARGGVSGRYCRPPASINRARKNRNVIIIQGRQLSERSIKNMKDLIRR